MSKDINATELTELINNNEVVLADFHATWCGPCKALAPIIDKLTDENTKAKIVKINVDENKETAVELGVRGVPTMIFFKNGKVAHKLVGLATKENIQAKINELLA
jgi:thioredoxin 1